MSRSIVGRLWANIALDRSLAVCLLGAFVLRCAAGAMGVMIQFYFEWIDKNVYPISNTEGGLIIASFFAAELLGAPLFGAWSDRYGRKRFIVLGPLLGAAAVQITAVTTVVWILVITRLLEGLSTAANAPATLGYISSATSHSSSLRGRVVGFFEVATVGGMALGLWLGGRLWDMWGRPLVAGFIHLTSPAFALDGVVYLLSFAILAWGLHENKPNAALDQRNPQMAFSVGGTWRRYLAIVTSRRVWAFVPAWLAINAVLGVWLNHFGRQLTRSRDFADQLLTGGFSPSAAGSLFAAFAVLFAAGILIWGLVLGRLRKTAVMLVGTGGLLVASVALLALNHAPSLSSPLVLPFGLVFAGGLLVMSGFTPAALAYLADITEDFSSDRGAIMGLYSVFLGIGQFAGSSLGGPFADWEGMDGIVLVTAIFGLFAGATIIRLRRTEQLSPHS
jgi:MFS family permease